MIPPEGGRVGAGIKCLCLSLSFAGRHDRGEIHIFPTNERTTGHRKLGIKNVLITSREVARFENRYREVLDGAGLNPIYPASGAANQPSEDEVNAALVGVEAGIVRLPRGLLRGHVRWRPHHDTG